MKLKAIAPLVAAIVLGLFAARMAMTLVANSGPKVVESTHFAPIAIAARDIEAGTTLTDADVALGKIDDATVPAGAYTTTAGPVNRVLKYGVIKGQPILPNTLADDGSGYGVAATLPKGMRAITVDINDTTGVAGFIQPQCKVDVVATIQSEGKPMSKTLLESVTVLAVGSRTNPNAPEGQPQQASKTVTLLVKPKDVERLELATNTSRVRLVLRNGRDTTEVDNAGITLADLKGEHDDAGDPFAASGKTLPATDVAIATTQPTRQSWTVEIIKGGATSTQTFDLPAPQAPADSEIPGALTELEHNK